MSKEIEVEIINPLTVDMLKWRDACLESESPLVNHSLQVQLAGLLCNIHRVVPTRWLGRRNNMRSQPPMPYAVYDYYNDGYARWKGLKTMWQALAYYLKMFEGSTELEAILFAEVRSRSMSTAAYNLKASLFARNPRVPLFITAHDLGNRDMQVITLNGDYMLTSKRTVSTLADKKDRKDWKAKTQLMLKRNGLSDIQAASLTGKISATAKGLIETEKLARLSHE